MPINYGMTRGDRRAARATKRALKDEKRAIRREARQDRPKGQGAPIDWSATTPRQGASDAQG